MTVDEYVMMMNRYPLSSYPATPFQKLFDATQQYLHNPADIFLASKRIPFSFNSATGHSINFANPSLELSKIERNFLGNHLWKSMGNGNNAFPQHGAPFMPLLGATQSYQSVKYFTPPAGSIDLFNSYLQGPSPDMMKYIEKVREDEMATKIKDAPEAKLCEDELWKRFNCLTTEMVITKSGRRMFPAFKVQLTGLDPKSKYVLALELMPCDDNRFKFHNGKWTLAGKADPESNRLIYFHCESPATGESWMQKAVWFNKVKLTNNPTDKDPQHLVLNSMHKYVMRLHVFRCDDTTKVRFCQYPEIFTFKTTEFIAVTAYQNDKITQLKIDNNPFAKGFRDNGSGRREKKRLKLQQTISSTSPDSPDDSEDESGKQTVIKRSPSALSECANPHNLPTEKSTGLDTSQNSIGSACSSQENAGRHSPTELDNLNASEWDDNVPQYSTLKRKSSCDLLSSDITTPTKRRMVSKCIEWDRSIGSLKECDDLQKVTGKSPHTVHYTPRKPPYSSSNPNGLYDDKFGSTKHQPNWNVWNLPKLDSVAGYNSLHAGYSLQMMSKLYRMMNQFQNDGLTPNHNNNDDIHVRQFQNITKPETDYQKDGNEPSTETVKSDNYNMATCNADTSQESSATYGDRHKSSAFNISSLI